MLHKELCEVNCIDLTCGADLICGCIFKWLIAIIACFRTSSGVIGERACKLYKIKCIHNLTVLVIMFCLTRNMVDVACAVNYHTKSDQLNILQTSQNGTNKLPDIKLAVLSQVCCVSIPC